MDSPCADKGRSDAIEGVPIELLVSNEVGLVLEPIELALSLDEYSTELLILCVPV